MTVQGVPVPHMAVDRMPVPAPVMRDPAVVQMAAPDVPMQVMPVPVIPVDPVEMPVMLAVQLPVVMVLHMAFAPVMPVVVQVVVAVMAVVAAVPPVYMPGVVVVRGRRGGTDMPMRGQRAERPHGAGPSALRPGHRAPEDAPLRPQHRPSADMPPYAELRTPSGSHGYSFAEMNSVSASAQAMLS